MGDVDYVSKSYTDGGVDLEPGKACLAQKCGAAASASRLYEVVQVSKLVSPPPESNGMVVAVGAIAVGAVAVLLAVTLSRGVVGRSLNVVTDEIHRVELLRE